MKILLDENLPIELANCFGPDHDVKTVNGMGWSNVKNGELLRKTAEAGFGFLVTMDKSIPFQQNISKLGLNFLILRAKDSQTENLLPLIPNILEYLRIGDIEQVKEFRP